MSEELAQPESCRNYDKPFIEINWYIDKYGDCKWRRKEQLNMEMTQYRKDLVRMWDSLRDKHKDTTTCITVSCGTCPLQDCCCGNNGNISFNSEKAIEIVTQWAKEHPVKTNADKFKEVWGCEPKNYDGMYYCPIVFGKSDCSGRPDEDMSCEECRKAFWNSEYIPPKKEGE